MKRIFVSCALIVAATVAGVAFSLKPATATAVGDEGSRYVALGDSVAAGAGLPPSVSAPEEQACARSDQAYPFAVATAVGKIVEHYACSGAKVDEGIYGRQTVGPNRLTPQLNRAFALGTPDLITMTVGANDARWAEFVSKCYQFSCGSRFDNAMVTALLADLKLELHYTLSKITYLSDGTPPQTILTGYFIPFNSSNVSCAETRNFTQAEMTWMNAQVARLNKAISNTAAWYGFADYVPIDFSGHELCSNDPWIQGIQAPAPMHPTAAGQAAMARAVIAAVE
jgi:lysophospholipase L1-like esterase